MKINVITIDGPSASGKGALALKISNHFGFKILDSGVLYRLYAYFFKMDLPYEEIAKQIRTNIRFNTNKKRLSITYKENDITSELRSEVIAKFVGSSSSSDFVVFVSLSKTSINASNRLSPSGIIP